MTDHLRLALLGHPHFEQNGGPVAGLSSVKARALLAYLAVTRQTHSRSALAGLLWGDMPEEAARTNLRMALSQLRKTVGGHLIITRQTAALNNSAAVWLDVAVLEAAAATGAGLRPAANLYRGDFLADFYVPDALDFEDWALVERERLRQLAVGVLHQLVDEALRGGSFAAGIRDARRILALEPWREEAHRQLMRLLAESGQRSAALAQFETCRQLLAQELGVAPSTATTALYQAIKAGAHQQQPPATGEPVAASPGCPHNLPAATTSFVGRQAEQGQLAQLLADDGCRLLTIIGPGGIGKTRLALAAAQTQTQIDAPFADGIFFVPLAALRPNPKPDAAADPVILAIATALGLTFSGGNPTPRRQLLDALRRKSMLLVLDNFEHLTASAGLLVEILEQAPGLKIMTTSREALNLYEEWIFELRGLSYPPADAASADTVESIELFVQRARRLYLGFNLAAERAEVGRICRLLEGLPLGIELAAAWVRTLSCREIADEVQCNLDFLAATVRNVPERQRSLRAAFEYSWQLLSQPEQDIFSQLTVFRGGFTGEAAAAVAGAPLRALSALVDKSLVQRAVVGRYQLHELLRQHGSEKLSDAAQVQTEHARFFADFLHRREESLIKGYPAAIADVAAEMDNLRAAWEWSVAQRRLDLLGQLLAGMVSFFELRGWFQEGRDLLAGALQRLESLPAEEPVLRLRGRLQLHLARFFDFLGYFEQARQHAEASVRLFQPLGETAQLAGALSVLGFALVSLSDNQQADACLQQSLRLAEQAGDIAGQAEALYYLNHIATRLGDRVAGNRAIERSLALYRALDHQRGMATCLYTLGNYQIGFGDYARAIAYYEESQPLHQQTGNRVGVAQCLMNRGLAAFRWDKLDEAAQLSAEAHTLFTEFGDQRGLGNTLDNLGSIAARRGQYDRARACFEQSLVIRQSMGDQLRLALTLAGLGNSAAGLGDRATASASFRQAIELAWNAQAVGIVLDILPEVADFLAQEKQATLAAVIAAHIEHHPAAEHFTRSEAQRLLAHLAQRLPPADFASVQAQGRAAPLSTVVTEILRELSLV